MKFALVILLSMLGGIPAGILGFFLHEWFCPWCKKRGNDLDP